MDINTIKIDLIHWLSELKDESVLKKLSAFKETNSDAALKELYTKRALKAEQDIKENKVYDKKGAYKSINDRLDL